MPFPRPLPVSMSVYASYTSHTSFVHCHPTWCGPHTTSTLNTTSNAPSFETLVPCLLPISTTIVYCLSWPLVHASYTSHSFVHHHPMCCHLLDHVQLLWTLWRLCLSTMPYNYHSSRCTLLVCTTTPSSANHWFWVQGFDRLSQNYQKSHCITVTSQCTTVHSSTLQTPQYAQRLQYTQRPQSTTEVHSTQTLQNLQTLQYTQTLQSTTEVHSIQTLQNPQTLQYTQRPQRFTVHRDYRTHRDYSVHRDHRTHSDPVMVQPLADHMTRLFYFYFFNTFVYRIMYLRQIAVASPWAYTKVRSKVRYKE